MTTYAANTLEVTVDLVGGSGTLSDWTINLAGEPGTDGAPGGLQSIVAGANVTVDNTDPANPVVSATGGGGDRIDVTEQGVDNTGVSDVTAELITLFQAGGRYFFPAGDYFIDGAGVDAGGVMATIANHLDVLCDPALGSSPTIWTMISSG